MKLKQSSIHKRVVITGYGAVTPLGENALMHWDAILNKRMGFKYFNKHNNNINTNFFGIVENEPDISFTPLALRRRLPKYTRLTLKAAQEAVSMAFGSQLPTDIYAP
ncbi:beta-ketoacyl synthase N-terminal-like domain-containing protein, partial [Escherichia coli]